MQRTIILGLVILTLFSMAGYAQTMNEFEVVGVIRNAELSMNGAADSIQREIVCRTKDQLIGQTVTISSAVVTNLDEEGFGRFDVNASIARKDCKVPGLDPMFFTRRDSQGFYTITMPSLEASKSVQDRNLLLRIAFSRQVLSNLRIGQKVSLSIDLVGFRASDPGREIYLSGIAKSVVPESKMLKCARGHEYAPSSGYRYCPIDGTPIQ